MGNESEGRGVITMFLPELLEGHPGIRRGDVEDVAEEGDALWLGNGLGHCGSIDLLFTWCGCFFQWRR